MEPTVPLPSPMTTDVGLRDFVEGLVARDNVLAVILFGSRARGNARPDSDFDLLVIRREGHARVVELVDGQAFEIVYETERGAREFWDANPDDAVALWQVARVLHDLDGTGARLRSLGDRILAKRPPPPSTERVAHARFDALDTLRAATAHLESDPATAVLLLNRVVESVVGLSFQWRGEWIPPPKQRLDALRRQDSTLGELVDRFCGLLSPEERYEVAHRIVEQVFASLVAPSPQSK